ncbi:MAG: PIN domain-containing protein [Actinomycetota bacterium]
MIHLDTSFLIRALQRRTHEDGLLRGWLRDRTEIGISAICWAEFLCGPLSPRDLEAAGRLFPEPEPFLADDSVSAAGLFNASGRRRGSLVDCMVAATALRAGAALATSNPSDFRRFEPAGLPLVRA